MSDFDKKSALATMVGNPKFTRAADFKTIYTNGVKMGISPWDFRMTFLNASEGAGGETVNEEVVTLVMSPQQAKAAFANWSTTLGMYEGLFGTIPDLAPILQQGANKAEAPEGNKKNKKLLLTKPAKIKP